MTEKIKSKITTAEKLGFAIFSTAMNVIYNMRSLYYMMFLTNILELSADEAGTIVAIGVAWDAINDPLIGLFCNNRRFKNGEKIRPYALWCAVPFAISAILVFTDFGLSHTATLVVCVLVYFLFEIFNTFICIPYNSMGSLATDLDSDRRSINMFRSLGACIGSALGTLCVPMIMKLFGGLKESKIISKADAKPLIFTAIALGAVCVIGCLAHYFTTAERVEPKEKHEDKLSLLEVYKLLFSCKSWVFNMLYVLGYGINNALMMTNITYYASYILGDVSASTPILACYLVTAVIISLTAGKIDTALGRKKTMILSCVVQALGKVPFIINPLGSLGIYINAITTGFGATLAFIMFNTNRNNIVDIIEYEKGKRIDSLAGAGDNLITKFAEAIANKLIGSLLAISGFVAALGLAQPGEVITSICAMLGWIPAAIAVFMTIVVCIMDITKEYNEAKASYEAGNK